MTGFRISVQSPPAGFYGDPYASYPTRLVDGTIASDAAGGTTLTRTWNGVSSSYQVYKTIQFGVTDWLTSSPRRLGVLATTQYNHTTTVTFPNAGTSDTSRIILQGDPQATQGTMPTIDLGATSAVHAFNPGASAATNDYITFRKLNVQNVAEGAVIACSNAGTYSNLVIEYCWLHNVRATGSPGESGGLSISNYGDATNPVTVRFCKIGDVQLPGGGTNANHSCVGGNGGVLYIYNNELYQCTNAMRTKGIANVVNNGWQFYNNLVHDVNICCRFDNGGTWPPQTQPLNGTNIYGNLFYWLNQNNAVFVADTIVNFFGSTNGQSNAPQPTNVSVYNNTASPEWRGVANDNVQNMDVNSNIILNNRSLSVGEYVPSFSLVSTFTRVDYNAYLNQVASSWEFNLFTGQINISTFNSGAALNRWTTFVTDYPAQGSMSVDPDAHGIFIPNLGGGFNTLNANFPNNASGDYTLAGGSPLRGAGLGGVDMGYNPANCGPGW